MILIDTNVFIEILIGGARGEEAVEKIGALAADERLAYSAITWFELCVKETQKQAAMELLADFQGIPLTLAIAERAAQIFSRHMTPNRRKIPDALIAATALASGGSLWTFNAADFRKIPHLKLLD